MKKQINENIRTGCKDMWNAFMTKDAIFSENDIPFCPTTSRQIPSMVITYSQAKTIHNKMIKENDQYSFKAFVCFYEDDLKFDGIKSGIWYYPKKAYQILKHFQGIITPDFSTYQDFPEPLKIWNTYRMRAFGYWYGTICKKQVINNVRWGTEESYSYCFDGIEKQSIIAIGTVGGSPRMLIDRERFEKGLFQMSKVLNPKIIIVYGSDKYRCFDELRKEKISVFNYESKTSLHYKKVVVK